MMKKWVVSVYASIDLNSAGQKVLFAERDWA